MTNTGKYKLCIQLTRTQRYDYTELADKYYNRTYNCVQKGGYVQKIVINLIPTSSALKGTEHAQFFSRWGSKSVRLITCNFIVATRDAACLLVVPARATMAGAFQLLLLLGLFCTVRVHASHFRGGIVMARPLPGGGENEVSLPVFMAANVFKPGVARPLAPEFVL